MTALPEPAEAFLRKHFPASALEAVASKADQALVTQVRDYVGKRFATMKYILGLALDFTLLAQALAEDDPALNATRSSLTENELFKRYTLVTQVGQKAANTLSVAFEANAKRGIRKFEEQVVALFHSLYRSEYPSAYVYNTGQWHKYRPLLLMCFQLSAAGRLLACRALIDFGLSSMTPNDFYGRPVERPRLFEILLNSYPRSATGENGGLTFQAIAYGYFAADRPHLILEAASVRTGSARQHRIGDIDCYRALDLEVSVEVKDTALTQDNFDRELAGFTSATTAAEIHAIVFARSIDSRVCESLGKLKIVSMPEHLAKAIVSTWDWPKQDAALAAMLHYLAHVEQNPLAVNRLLAFIASHDPDYEALAFYDGDGPTEDDSTSGS